MHHCRNCFGISISQAILNEILKQVQHDSFIFIMRTFAFGFVSAKFGGCIFAFGRARTFLSNRNAVFTRKSPRLMKNSLFLPATVKCFTDAKMFFINTVNLLHNARCFWSIRNFFCQKQRVFEKYGAREAFCKTLRVRSFVVAELDPIMKRTHFLRYHRRIFLRAYALNEPIIKIFREFFYFVRHKYEDCSGWNRLCRAF